MMDGALLIGRIMLVALFLNSGYGKLMDIPGLEARLAGIGLPMPIVLAWAAALAEVIGGLLVVLGWQTRLGALALIAFTAAATYYFHPFWAMEPGQAQTLQMIQAWKNLGIIGGLVVLIGAGPGRISIDGRRDPSPAY
jgi:putative oxidoreductase